MKKNIIKSLVLGVAISTIAGFNAKAATYTVNSGDTLFKIGQTFNTTYTNLMKTNSLVNSTIYPKQKIEVPANLHTVKAGDTLYLIAKKYGVSLDKLRQANNKWDNLLFIGDKLLIPNIVPSPTTTSGSSTSINNNYSQADIDLMARLVTAEAEDQPYNAKVAVAAVVINRVKSNLFAHTVNDVIYEKINGYYQFTPVLNGFINKPASQSSINAVYDAINGKDPSNGALFYFDDSATNQWLWSKPITAQIGRMVFAR